MNWNFGNSISWATLALLALNSCGPSGPVIDEEDDPAFDRGRSYLKVGKEEEALDEFLSVTRRMVECPKSHLEAGRLLLSLSPARIPFPRSITSAAIFFLSPNQGKHRR